MTTAKTPRQKGQKGDGMRRTTVRLPEDLFRELKVKAAQEDKSIQDLITLAVERVVKGGKEKN